MGKKKRKQQAAQPERSFEINPFANLKIDLVNAQPPDPIEKAESSPSESAEDSTDFANLLEHGADQATEGSWSKTFQRQVLKIHLEKKGRGGKSVTILSGFDLDMEAEVQVLVSKLKKTLGTGGTVKIDQLEIQGDQRTKVAQWLSEQGFRVKGDIPR